MLMKIKTTKKNFTIGILLTVLLSAILVKAAIPDTLTFRIENSTDTVFTVDKLGHGNFTGNIQTDLDLVVGGNILAGNDKLKETIIDFDTSCGPGNHLYVNGNNLACEADATGEGGNTSAEIIAAVNVSDAYYQISVKDLTCTNCIGGTEIDESSLVGVPSYNASYDEQLGHNTTAEIQGVSVGGETSGTVGSITLSDTALDDQYVQLDNSTLNTVLTNDPNDYDQESDLTAVLDDNYMDINQDDWVDTTGDTMTGNLTMQNPNTAIVTNATNTYAYFGSDGTFVIHLET